MTDTLTITRPDDWHLHVRDGAAMAAVVPATAIRSVWPCPNMMPSSVAANSQNANHESDTWPTEVSSQAPALAGPTKNHHI